MRLAVPSGAIDLPGCVCRLAVAASQALHVHDVNVVAVGCHCAWIPAGRQKPFQETVRVLDIREFDDRDGIITGAGNKQYLAVRAQGQAIGGAAYGRVASGRTRIVSFTV